VGNTFLAIVIDVDRLRGKDPFSQDVEELIEFVKSSALAPGFTEILIPGEPEARVQSQREREGIPVDEETWRQIVEVAEKYGVVTPSSRETKHLPPDTQDEYL
jgi:uncharacterized oxidoreductase